MNKIIVLLSACTLGLAVSCGDPSLQSQSGSPNAETSNTASTSSLQHSQESSAKRSSQKGTRHSTEADGKVAQSAQLTDETPSEAAKDIAQCKDSDYASSSGQAADACSKK